MVSGQSYHYRLSSLLNRKGMLPKAAFALEEIMEEIYLPPEYKSPTLDSQPPNDWSALIMGIIVILMAIWLGYFLGKGL